MRLYTVVLVRWRDERRAGKLTSFSSRGCDVGRDGNCTFSFLLAALNRTHRESYGVSGGSRGSQMPRACFG